jgi:hypothetical protein
MDHRLGRVGYRAVKIAKLPARIGAQHEQFGAGCHGDRLPQRRKAGRRTTFAHFQSSRERGHPRRPWHHALGHHVLGRRQQCARRTRALRAEQLIRAAGQCLRIGSGVEQVHAGLLLSWRGTAPAIFSCTC